MNPNYTHTITLYNRIRAANAQDRKEKWIRTVISGCFYKAQVNTSLTTQATVSNTYVARIPKNPRYLPYAEFIKKPAGCFTVSLDDIVVEGVCREEITGIDGHTATQLLNRNKPNAFKITAFSDNTAFRVGKHYRLGG